MAAFDLAKAAAAAGQVVSISCYTYGAPRVGNHAFAREFCEVVPDCWNVTNDQVHLTLCLDALAGAGV